MIARSEYGRGREALSSLEGTQLERTQEAEVRYLSGLASYLEVCGLLDACGEAVPFRFMGVLRVEHRAMLSSACGDFLTASDLAPEAPFAAEAAYLAARTQDYGFLQNFTRAMELYRWCVIAYPGTPAAERSRVRYEVLKQRFESMEGTGHGTEGE